MTKYEVVKRTLNFEKTPYIPVVGWAFTKEFLLEVTGEKEFTKYNARRIYLRAMQELDCDMIMQYVLPFPERYDKVPEAAMWTVKHHFTESIIYKPLTFKSPEEVRDYILSLPEPNELEKDFSFEENYLAWIELMEKGMEYMGDMVWLPGFIANAPDFMLYNYFGYENYLMALQLYKDEMKKLFEISAEEFRLRNQAIAKAIKDKHYLNWVYIGHDICFKAGPLCSPSLLKEIYWPAARHSLKPLKDAGIKLLWHCDGNINPILEDLIDIGVDGLQGFEEESGVNLERLSNLRSKAGNKIALFGSLSVTTTLPLGTVAEVEEKIRRVVDLSKKRGGGMVLATSSSIMPGTPNENVYPLFRYSKSYSKRIFGLEKWSTSKRLQLSSTQK